MSVPRIRTNSGGNEDAILCSPLAQPKIVSYLPEIMKKVDVSGLSEAQIIELEKYYIYGNKISILKEEIEQCPDCSFNHLKKAVMQSQEKIKNAIYDSMNEDLKKLADKL